MLDGRLPTWTGRTNIPAWNCASLRKPTQERGRAECRSGERDERAPRVLALPFGPGRLAREVQPAQAEAEHRTCDFQRQRRDRDSMNVGELAGAGVADRTKARAACALSNPSTQGQPGQAALALRRRRTLRPPSACGCARYGDGAEVVNDLVERVSEILRIHGHLAAALRERPGHPAAGAMGCLRQSVTHRR